MTMGPETEKRLRVSRQLPTPDDAVIDKADGYRLQYLFNHYTNWYSGMLRRFMQVYGPTIACPPLRSVALACFSDPVESPEDSLIERAIRTVTAIDFSKPSEGEFFAVALLGLPISLMKRPFGTVTPSVCVRWFKEIVKQLLCRGKACQGSLLSPVGQLAAHIFLQTLPVSYRGPDYWDLYTFVDESFGISGFVPYESAQEWFIEDHWRAASETTRNEYIWETRIGLNFQLAIRGFLHVLDAEMATNANASSSYIIPVFQDVQTFGQLFEKSEVYLKMLEELWSRSDTSIVYENKLTPLNRSLIFWTTHCNNINNLLASLVLCGRSVEYALKSDDAVAAAVKSIYWMTLYPDFCTRPGLSRLIPFPLLSAALVYRISENPEGIHLEARH